ncbi:MAG: hypothetical protein QXU75_06185 [Candidatus Methanomethylicaceae archaeon]
MKTPSFIAGKKWLAFFHPLTGGTRWERSPMMSPQTTSDEGQKVRMY